ncbi:ribosyldihydronicotinamide dehydrogenase [quinone] isoform 9 [Mus musculus]|nr:ribosyldihydronicotinamide dehydrogenase [quinone] isoform 9 [Mus musculus]
MNFEPRATRNDITGAPSNPDVFSYGIETHEAYKKKALTSDIFEEQRKVQEADLVIFQHGTLHFCGFKVLAPQISFGLDVSSEEERKVMLASWAQRLKSIWKEEPIHCTPPWYFQE